MIKNKEDNKVTEKTSTAEYNGLSSEDIIDEQIISDYKNNKSKYEPMCSLEDYCRKCGIEL